MWLNDDGNDYRTPYQGLIHHHAPRTLTQGEFYGC